MPISMTRAQYQATYGAPPSIPDAPQTNTPNTGVQSQQDNASQPIKMTRAEYQQKYGQSPNLPDSNPTSTTDINDSEGMSIAKGVGNFLFPIVGDVADDISGKSKKTFLQQAGDTALSALPFIPGLGEAGEAARGVEAGVEGARALKGATEGTDLASKIYEGGSNIASNVKGTVTDLVNKIPGGTIGKGAVTGYGAGVASNLSQGQGLDTAFGPNLNTIAGTALGGLAPLATKGLSKLQESLANIDPQVKNELTKMGSEGNPKDAQLYNQYINATKDHATDFNKTSPLEMAADQVDKAAQVVQKKTDLAGQVVGKAKEQSENIPLQPINSVGNSFWKDIQDKYGINLYTGKNGKIIAKKVADSMIDNSPSDISRITNIAQQLSDLSTKGGTTKNATEVMGNIRKLIGDAKNEGYGERGTQFEGVMKHTISNLNDVVRKTSPALAKANDNFSGLKDLQDEISKMAGKNVDKGALLMKRRFSGDKAGEVSDFFGKMRKATGIDLSKHAVMAKNAIESVGGRADRTRLEDIMKEAIGGASTISGKALNVGVNMIRDRFANPEKLGRKLVQGKSGVINALGKSAYGIPAKVGAEASRLTSFLNL